MPHSHTLDLFSNVILLLTFPWPTGPPNAISPLFFSLIHYHLIEYIFYLFTQSCLPKLEYRTQEGGIFECSDHWHFFSIWNSAKYISYLLNIWIHHVGRNLNWFTSFENNVPISIKSINITLIQYFHLRVNYYLVVSAYFYKAI